MPETVLNYGQSVISNILTYTEIFLIPTHTDFFFLILTTFTTIITVFFFFHFSVIHGPGNQEDIRMIGCSKQDSSIQDDSTHQ